MKRFKIYIALILSIISTSLTFSFSADANTFEKPDDSAEAIAAELYEVSNEKNAPEDIKKDFEVLLVDLFESRNDAVVKGDTELLKNFYDLKIKVSQWAYESEAKKTEYLINWSEKQSVKFHDLHSIVKVRKVKEREKDLYGVICDVATEFNYSYTDTPSVNNSFRLGTNHYLNIKKVDDKYIITKEWYTDPFADSLDINKIKSKEIDEFILSKTAPDFTASERLTKAMDYAHKYCGVSTDEEYIFKYNPNYKNFNPDGGDCANFASQILHEGGFKKNSYWNYSSGQASKAWVNAQGFKNYMVGSGKASYIAKGSYNQTYKTAFNMRPGDFVAYEKKGRITHISTVTGFDSKGYPLVTCHNTNRLLVPYDLGWSNSNITFHLIHVHY